MHQKSNIVQYDDFAETFGQSRRDLHWQEIDNVLSDFIKRPSLSGKIADIGCGNGRLLEHIRQHPGFSLFRKNYSQYIGLDASTLLVDQARLSDWTDVFSSYEFIVGDMREIESDISAHGFFDALFFIASFHHLSRYEERLSVLIQAKKLLSKSGVIIMTNWNLSHPSQTKYQSSKISDYPDKSADYKIKIGEHERFYHAFSHEEYLRLAQESGLDIVDDFGERNSTVYWS